MRTQVERVEFLDIALSQGLERAARKITWVRKLPACSSSVLCPFKYNWSFTEEGHAGSVRTQVHGFASTQFFPTPISTTRGTASG